VNYIHELKDAIRRVHNVDSRHVESVPVTETYQGTIIWDGFVEVFDLVKHSEAQRAYAWSYDLDGLKKSRKHVVVLHVPPVTSPEFAVRTALLQEFKDLGQNN
jgi:hypothetical protein